MHLVLGAIFANNISKKVLLFSSDGVLRSFVKLFVQQTKH